MKTKEVSKIYQTTDYSKFIVNAEFYNNARINFLMYKTLIKNEKLPLVIVRKVDSKLEIVSEQDSFYAAKQMGLPIYYYEAYQSVPRAKQTIDFSFNDMEELLNYCLNNGHFDQKVNKDEEGTACTTIYVRSRLRSFKNKRK